MMKPFSNPKQNSKKTRDLPNLSQCQSCNFRIDICSGKSTLHTLYSEWRIVLLCKDCFFLVESSEICSYCFKESSLHNPCYNCCNCNRIVHKSCVLEHGFVAPWSYCCSSSDLFTCVDCWIPKSLANKRRVPRSGKKRKFLESRSSKESYEKKSVEAALMAVRKALTGRGAVELESNAVEEGNCDGGDGRKSDGGDAQLAIQLHRAMNSSPRIVNKFLAANSSSFPTRRLPGCNGEIMAKQSGGNNTCGSAGRQLVCGISRNFVCDSLGLVDDLTSNGAYTIRVRHAANVDSLGLQLKEGEERCSTNKLINLGVDADGANCASQFLRQENEIPTPKEERCFIERDGYLMKYSRRKLNESSTPASGPLSFFECVRHETQPLTIEPLQLRSKESPVFPNSSPCSSPKVFIRSSGLTSRQNREGNAITLAESERCCRQPDRYLVKYSRRNLAIRYLMKYSRRKLKKRNRAGTSRCVENSELQPEEREGCYSKWINSSADDKSINTACQYFREENGILIREDEKCCSHSDGCLMKYSRRKLNKRDRAGMLRMRESANIEKSESQEEEREESCYEKWINSSVEDKNMNTASQSCWKENEIMVPENEGFCRHLDRYLMKYNRRKLPRRYSMKYSRKKLNKRNVADTPKMGRTSNVESSQSQPKEEEESCSSGSTNSNEDDDGIDSASQPVRKTRSWHPKMKGVTDSQFCCKKSISPSDFLLHSPLKASIHSRGLSEEHYRNCCVGEFASLTV